MVSVEELQQFYKLPESGQGKDSVTAERVAKEVTWDLVVKVVDLIQTEKDGKLEGMWNGDVDLVMRLLRELIPKVGSEFASTEFDFRLDNEQVREKEPVWIGSGTPLERSSLIDSYTKGHACFIVPDASRKLGGAMFAFTVNFTDMIGTMSLPEGYVKEVSISFTSMLPELKGQPGVQHLSMIFSMDKVGSEDESDSFDFSLVPKEIGDKELVSLLRAEYRNKGLMKIEPEGTVQALDQGRDLFVSREVEVAEEVGNEAIFHGETTIKPLGILQLASGERWRVLLNRPDFAKFHKRSG